MRFSQSLRIVLLIFSAVAMSGCTIPIGSDAREKVDPTDPHRSLIFGYIDMSDAPSSLGWVKVQRYGSERNQFYSCGVKDGLFWHVGIPPGSYQVESFGKAPGFFSNTHYRYDFGASGRNQTARRIMTSGLYFLGAYKYTEVAKQRWFLPDKFKMVPIASPSEKALLTKLLEIMYGDDELMQYTQQIEWANARLTLLDKGISQ